MNPETCIKCSSLDIITDHRSGDVVCRGCGEVQAERLVDEGAEWNRYDDNDGKGDPSRVGGELGGTASRIWGGPSASAPGAAKGSGKKRKTGGAAAMTGADLVNKKSKGQSKLEKVCMVLSDTVRSLHLDERITQVGFTIADSANTEGAFRGKAEAVLVAAVLYLSCKHCGIIKSIAEVCAHLDVDKYEVGRVINEVSRKVKALEAVVFTPEEVVDKYGGQLHLPLQLRLAAVEVMKAARQVPGLEGLHPQTLAGASLLLLCNTKKLQDHLVPGDVASSSGGGGGVKKEEGGGDGVAAFPPPLRTVEDIAGATLVSMNTIKKTHALLYEHWREVVPAAYAAEMESHHLELRDTKELATANG